ncbi:MAG: flagellar filament capping protein FliD, partial [Gemmatimonadaceae bacterium]
MSNPVTSFSGLSSGIQWGDIVDKLNAAEQAREVTPITKSIDLAGKRRTAWTAFQTQLYGLNDAARVLRNGSVGALTTSAGTSPTTSRTLFSSTAGLVASPGTYQVEVSALAQQEKVGGNVVTDVAAAAGISGTFTLNGATITVAATDSLNGIRDKINSANSGTTPTGVTASILSNGGTAGRLVMTATNPGANGITLTDGTTGTARDLGFLDTTSRKLSSINTAVATALGIAPPPAPASIVVGGRTITLDLSVDTLSAVMAKINAAGGQSSIKTETNGGGSLYSLVVSDNVQAVSGNSASAAVISALGLSAGGRSSVQQTITSAVMTGNGGALASSGTKLTNLSVAGVTANISSGDAINIRGTRGDGTVVSVGITVSANDTVQTLLDKINSAPSAFGGGTRTATASLGSDGKIRVVDSTGGESKLSFSMDVTKADGTSGTLGTTSTERIGRERAVAAGSNAEIKIDGVSYSRASNTVGDVIPGVTLNLQQAEAGTTVAFQVSRDTATITAS